MIYSLFVIGLDEIKKVSELVDAMNFVPGAFFSSTWPNTVNEFSNKEKIIKDFILRMVSN
jgi:hypothetical protein